MCMWSFVSLRGLSVNLSQIKIFVSKVEGKMNDKISSFQYRIGPYLRVNFRLWPQISRIGGFVGGLWYPVSFALDVFLWTYPKLKISSASFKARMNGWMNSFQYRIGPCKIVNSAETIIVILYNFTNMTFR